MKRDAIIYCLVQGIGAILILWLCLTLVGCKSQQPIVTETNTNTLIEREQVDSLIKVAGKKCTIIKIKVSNLWKRCNKFAYSEIK